ncbi:ferredoxin [Mycobacterium sp. NPDC049093]
MAVRPDNRLDDAPMAPVTCARCGAGVEVRKSSWNQTSVQWSGAALARCEERCTAAQLAGNGGHGLFLACSALGVSIADAVRTGALQVVDETS